MKNFNENWDGINRQRPLNEEVTLKHWSEMGAYAKAIRGEASKIQKVDDAKNYLTKVASSLLTAANQQNEFLDGLIGEITDARYSIRCDSGQDSPETKKKLDTIIAELKKYKRPWWSF
jgi:hypothetical protein